MSWGYSGNPASSDRDRIRFLIGDTKETTQSLADGELDYLLSTHPSPEAAAAAAAEAMADRYAGLSVTTKRVGDLSLSYEYGQTGDRFMALAKRLRQRHWGIAVPLMADESPKQFSTGVHDFPASGERPFLGSTGVL
jgi:hypothetical protein